MTNKKSGLGRGIDAIMGNGSENVATGVHDPAVNGVIGTAVRVTPGTVIQIPLDKIERNPYQPRVEFDLKALQELADSIRSQGIIQPITVSQMGSDRFQIISGERRFKASAEAGLKTIPAYVRTANDQGMLEMALVENIQRAELNAFEIAMCYQRLIKECNLTQEKLAERVGMERPTVTNYLRLLKLPDQIQAAIRDGRITMGHAKAILGVDDIGMQLKIFKDTIENKLSVRQVEELAGQQKKGDKKKGRVKEELKSQTAFEIRDLKDRLERRYSTKVVIKHKNSGVGHIQINYFSNDDLNRLMELLDFD